MEDGGTDLTQYDWDLWGNGKENDDRAWGEATEKCGVMMTYKPEKHLRGGDYFFEKGKKAILGKICLRGRPGVRC